MDAVAFPPPPAPFLDDDFDFGDFTFASAPPTPPTATSAAASSSWEKPRGPLPLSLFGADDDQEDGREEEGPAEPQPPAATAHQRAASFTTDGSRPADLKDLIAGLYGSQPPTASVDADAGPQEDGEGFGDDDWEFTAATAEPADQDGGGRAPRDGIRNIEVSWHTLMHLLLP